MTQPNAPAVQQISSQTTSLSSSQPSGQPSSLKPPKLQRPGHVALVVAFIKRSMRSVVNGFGPGAILDKELRVQGRRVGTYWVRFIYAAMLAAFVCIALFSQSDILGTHNSTNGTLSRIESLQSTGPDLLLIVTWVQFCGLLLAAVIFAAPLICEERRTGTLATLLTTPLSAWQIVSGKLCGASVQLVILGLIAVPVLLATRVFGGITGEMIFATSSIVVTTTLAACALGLLASVISTRTSAAFGLALALIVGWNLILPIALFLVSTNVFTISPDYINASSPGAGLINLSQQIATGITGSNAYFWVWNVVTNIAVMLLALLFATARLRVVLRQQAVGKIDSRSNTRSPVISPEGINALISPQTIPTTDANGQPLSHRAQRKANVLAVRRAALATRAAARAQRNQGSRTVGDSPILWRELRQPIASKYWVMWLGILIFVGLITWSLIASEGDETVAFIATTVGAIICYFSVAIGAPTSITSERDSRTWEALLSTPISASDILVAKLLGILTRLRLVLGLTFGSLIIAGVIVAKLNLLVVVHIAMILAPTLALVANAGLYFAVSLRRASGAGVLTLASMLGVWLLLPGILSMCAAAFSRHTASENFISFVAVTNPAAWIVVALDGANLYSYRHNYHDVEYEIFNFGSAGPFAFTVVLGIFSLVYSGFAYAMFIAARNTLAARTLRRK